MSKRIMCIEREIPGLEMHSFWSDQSLLDADIIVFQPDLGHLLDDRYEGYPSCSESMSAHCIESVQHWQTEIETAVSSGKTVFVLLNKYQEFFVHTGEKRFSGTGRNQQVTRMLTKRNNYECLPIGSIDVISKGGDTIKFLNNPAYLPLWNETKGYFVYDSYFNQSPGVPLFVTKTGNKAVGCVVTSKENGHLVLLPQLMFPEEFVEELDDGTEDWTEKAKQFGKRFAAALVEVDAALRKEGEAIPAPSWVDEPEYSMAKEPKLLMSIASITAKVEKLSKEKADKNRELSELQSLKYLLYGKGFPLQYAVIEALELLGYKAEGYDDGELEIDQVIVSPEGDRFVGETEGKDNSKVNVDKFRQLFDIVDADAAREDIEEEATGILFGNGHRTLDPSEREVQFTDKCLKSAERRSVVLVQTSDLFRVAQYLHHSGDEKLAAKCRVAIKNSEGKIVEFPALPSSG